MIVVTGGAGFIGSNLVFKLNQIGHKDIIIVDNLTNGLKGLNLTNLKFSDYIDFEVFHDFLDNYRAETITHIFHLGACSSTKEWNGRYLMDNNYEYSKRLLHWCQVNSCSLIYASSAAIYGLGAKGFTEGQESEFPINMYAVSKWAFDNYIRLNFRKLTSQVVGLRYFNVFGPNETHKNDMSSPVHQFSKQIIESNECLIFGAYDGIQKGQHKRDFVYVSDCADVNIFFMENKHHSGIYNVGSGHTHTFEEVAHEVINWFIENQGLKPTIRYVDFPESLKGAYQSFTCADIRLLRKTGYDRSFTHLKDAVGQTLSKTYL